jgi:hypothetical protein
MIWRESNRIPFSKSVVLLQATGLGRKRKCDFAEKWKLAVVAADV